MWIHQLKEWPKFQWDAARLASKLADVRHQQGLLLGRMAALGFTFKLEASLTTLTSDVVKSSAIEGEELNPETVRSSIARKLGLDIGGTAAASRDVEGIVEIMLDATQRYDKSLTKERLFEWHEILFPTKRSGLNRITVGAWRTDSHGPMQVVSGLYGRERVHFEAPAAKRLKGEMKRFLAWFASEKSSDPVIKAALAHLWFVTIHPFDDGNGRIARAITDLCLARADGSRERFYSISTQFEAERDAYYEQLERQQRGDLDVTGWLEWFLECLGRAIASAETNLAAVIYKAKFWNQANKTQVNERQKLVLNKMLNGFRGHMSTSKYAKLAKCSTDTALRDIQELIGGKILFQNPTGGRSTNYRLATLDELLNAESLS